jgi:hypothetical protein
MHCDDLELEQESSSLEDERVLVNLERNGEHSVPIEGFVRFEHNAHECNGEHSVIEEFVNDDELLEEFIADCSIPSVNTSSRHRSVSISSTVTPTQADEPPITQETDQAGAIAVDQDGLQSGEAFIVPSDFDSGRFCFANNDCAMMRTHHICDTARTSVF